MNADGNNFNKLDTHWISWQIFYHDKGVLQNKTSDDVRITDETCKVTYLQVFLNQIKKRTTLDGDL
jgi:hypothetical protein